LIYGLATMVAMLPKPPSYQQKSNRMRHGYRTLERLSAEPQQALQLYQHHRFQRRHRQRWKSLTPVMLLKSRAQPKPPSDEPTLQTAKFL
jgi:hypothetical protein